MTAPNPCGTSAAYRRHLRYGEPTCPDCRRAQAESVAAWRAQAGSALSYKHGGRTRRKRPQSPTEVAA
jgi:hypothetical protein